MWSCFAGRKRRLALGVEARLAAARLQRRASFLFVVGQAPDVFFRVSCSTVATVGSIGRSARSPVQRRLSRRRPARGQDLTVLAVVATVTFPRNDLNIFLRRRCDEQIPPWSSTRQTRVASSAAGKA